MYFLILVIGCSEADDIFYRTIASIDDIRVSFTDDWDEAQSIIIREAPQVVILDDRIVKEKGLSMVSHVRGLTNSAKVFVVSKCPTVELAVGSVKAGADDFLTTPPDLVKFRTFLKDDVEEWRLEAFGKDFFKKQRAKYDFSNIYGESAEIRKVFRLVKKIIPSRRASVLIQGETGTGKGLIARAIHYNTVNGDLSGVKRPFVEINCTAIPDNLLESELFGYEKGAFTDAKAAKKGLFELANGGTMFLDEIGYMNQNLQVKLLKVVEEKTFRKLGGTRDISVDLRIIAGTNKNLEKAIEEGHFRKDLYYRLNVFTVRLPLLKDRGNDIILLAQHFLDVYNREHRRNVKGFSPDALDLMMAYHWPGNVRELKNAVERGVLMEESELLSVDNLPIRPGLSDVDDRKGSYDGEGNIVLELGGVGIPLEMIEKEVVEKVLVLNNGNRSKTARILKISRPKLLRMIKKFSIEV